MNFNNLALNENIQKAIQETGYTQPTPIQEQAIPPLLEGKDVVGIAQTGTGKSAAFILPLLDKLSKTAKASSKRPKALILTPTRELAAQIEESCDTYGKYSQSSYTVVYGGVNQHPQVRALKKGVDILVATPGRLMDLMDQGHVRLDDVETFVLDEADRMLDMGFIVDIDKIKPKLNNQHQTVLFSATMSKEIQRLTKKLQQDPVHVEIQTKQSAADNIQQKMFYVDKAKKMDLLLHLLKQDGMHHVLIFTATKRMAEKVAKDLTKHNIQATAIHGDKSQNQRTRALSQFAKKKTFLVGTDVAARGIDVEGISHVINYDLPQDPENYVHRIGRTGRAGAEGTAYSFSDETENDYLRAIYKVTGEFIPVAEHKYHSNKAQHSTIKAKRGGGNWKRKPKSKSSKGGFERNKNKQSQGKSKSYKQKKPYTGSKNRR
jgi:ATP-dependent RNA helicase RhlE